MNNKLRFTGCDHLVCHLVENDNRLIFNIVTLNKDTYRLDLDATVHRITFSFIEHGQSEVTVFGYAPLTIPNT